MYVLRMCRYMAGCRSLLYLAIPGMVYEYKLIYCCSVLLLLLLLYEAKTKLISYMHGLITSFLCICHLHGFTKLQCFFPIISANKTYINFNLGIPV